MMRVQLILKLEKDFGPDADPEIIQVILEDMYWRIIEDAEEQGFSVKIEKVDKTLDTR